MNTEHHMGRMNAENDADECERCEGTGDRYGRRPYVGVPPAQCPDCTGTGRVSGTLS